LQNNESNLSTVIDLPLLYGFFLIENLRRIQWDNEIRLIATKTAENFASIEEKELNYRNIWVKNYGLILKILNLESIFLMNNLSSIEITTNKDNTIKQINLNISKNDILNYIENLKNIQISNESIDLLLKNLNNLENQKVNLNSKFNPYLNMNISKDQNSIDNQVIQGYESRIKKLESLLHQHKYKNLNQWPILFPNIKSNSSTSLKTLNKTNNNSSNQLNSSSIFTDFNNPAILQLQRRLSLQNQRSNSTVSLNKISTITTIDTSKITSNSHQRRKSSLEKTTDSSDFQADFSALEEENNLKSIEIEKMKIEMNDKELAIKNIKAEIANRDIIIKTIESEKTDKDSHMSLLNDQIKDKNFQINELSKQIDIKSSEINELHKEINKQKSAFKNIKESYDEINSMKQDLLANMASKEVEVTKERNELENELSNLQLKIENLEDIEDVLEKLNKDLAAKNSQLINVTLQLLELSDNFIVKLKNLSHLLFKNFSVFCISLESMGLLLTKSSMNNLKSFINGNFAGSNQYVKIVRVKGLRNKIKNQKDDDVNNVNSILVGEAEKALEWTKPQTQGEASASLSSDKVMAANESIQSAIDSPINFDVHYQNTENIHASVDSQAISITKIENKASFLLENYNNSEFESGYLQFLSSINVDSELITASISKRFLDVEHLAKKLQKESRSQKENFNTLMLSFRSKVSIKSFQPDDLVLFLPTRDVNDSVAESNISNSSYDISGIENSYNRIVSGHFWTAFNIGCPHYFLKEEDPKVLLGRDWVLVRIVSITEHAVTSENHKNPTENPFSLSQGIIWYLVEAQEE
ncbi:autophagy protein ATG11 ASCRUDRAFT_19000, partial [Ascoidea rubescens DSM 1968]